ncbi:Ig-like domain-containing protein [Nitratidesulfovibrio termitidis]|uniref:Ig-like domain-containing protein n=1 Tax=Nitratidesulfovibrio termitidis TaxID=42252 RepID=UPI001CA322FA|nr:Ig-like domain-containing protein [Nitratidesulfovibrio termitidis]
MANNGYTNDTTPTLSGTLSAALVGTEAVHIFRGGTDIGTATVTGTTWTYTDTLSVDGNYTYSAVVIDGANNQGTASNSYSIRLDATPPTQTVTITLAWDSLEPTTGAIPNNGVTNDDTPEIRGTISSVLSATEAVHVFRDGVDVGTATVTGTTWTYTDGGLSSGSSYTYTAKVVDQAGNTSAESNSIGFTVDTSGVGQQAIIGGVTDDQAPVTGTVADNGYTNDTTPTVFGTLTAPLNTGETVQVLRGGVVVGTATVTGTTWTFAETSALADGDYTYQARIINAATVTGGESNQYTIHVDTAIPAQTVDITGYVDNEAPKEGTFAFSVPTNDTTPMLQGTLSATLAADEVVAIYRDNVRLGTASVVGGTDWIFQDSGLADGTSYSYYARVEDLAGNRGASSTTVTLRVDTTAPATPTAPLDYNDDVAPVVDANSTAPVTNDARPGVNVGTGHTDTVSLYVDGVKVAATYDAVTGTLTPNANIADGLHDFTYTLTDTAGNESTQSGALAITIDTAAPGAPAITDVYDDLAPVIGTVASGSTTNDTTPTLSGTAEANATVSIYDGATLLGATTADSGGNWTYTPGSSLAGGSHSFTVTATDVAGNTSGASSAWTINITTGTQTVSIDVVYDNVSPPINLAVPSGTYTDDSSPELRGSLGMALATGEVVAIYRNGAKIGEASVTGTNWTYQDTGLTTGHYDYEARVEDSAGNPGAVSAHHDIYLIVENMTPVITSIIDDVDPVQGTIPNGGYTNDASPMLEGNLGSYTQVPPSFLEVHMFRDGVDIGEVTVLSDGSWTFQDTGVTDGEHAYSIRTILENGNGVFTGVDRTIIVDTTAPPQTVTITQVWDNVDPVQGAVANGAETNDSTPEIRGSLSAALAADEVVAVYRDGAYAGTATVTGTNWEYTDSGLSNGTTYEYTARVEDRAGNAGSYSSGYSITVKTQPSPTTVTLTDVIDDQLPEMGYLSDNGYTNDTTPLLQGSLSAPLTGTERVHVFRNGVDIGTATNFSTTWTFEDPGLPADGNYTYYAVIIDGAGNPGTASTTWTINLDTSVPPQTVVVTRAMDDVGTLTGQIPDNGVTDDDSPEIQGTISAVLSSTEEVHVFRDGADVGTATVSGTNWTFTDVGLASGSYYVYTAKVVDRAGNAGAESNSIRFMVDTAPVDVVGTITDVTDNQAPVTGSVTNGGYTNDTSPLLSGTLSRALSSGESLQVLRDGALVGTATVTGTTWTYQEPDAALADGEHTYEVRGINAAQVTGQASDPYTIHLDTAVPSQTTTITGYTDDQPPQTGTFEFYVPTNDNNPTIVGTISATLGADEVVVIYRDGARLGTATVTGGTNWTYQDWGGLSDGTSYSYMARVEDLAGNHSTDSTVVTLRVDMTPPQEPINIISFTDDVGTDTGTFASGSTTDDTLPVLNGTIGSPLLYGERVNVYMDGAYLGIATVTDTSWYYDLIPEQELAEGTYTFTATMVDQAGNEGSHSAGFTLTVDTTAPTQTVAISNYTDNVGAAQGDFLAGTTTDDRTPTLNGTLNMPLEAGERVRVYDAATNTLLGEAVVNGTNWHYEITEPLLDGSTVSYRAVVADAAGNEGVASSSFSFNVDLQMFVDSQSTLDHTPIVVGHVAFDIQPGEYVEVTINGVTYSSRNGAVVVDPQNATWYVQIPDAAALAEGTYDVQAVLKQSDGTVIVHDDTSNELVVAPTPAITVGAGGNDVNQKGTAVTINKEGMWLIHTNQAMLTSSATSSATLGSFTVVQLTGNRGGTGYDSNNYVQNAVFIDYNRDGRPDLFAADSDYDDGQQMFYNTGSGWVPYQVGANTSTAQSGDFAGDADTDGSANVWSWYGGIIGIDKDGDGWVDIIYGDRTPNDSGIQDGYGSQIVLNHDGTIVGMDKDGNFATDYATDSSHRPIGLDQSQPDMSLSGVDINNDGLIDFVMHAQDIVADGTRITKNGSTNISTNLARLVVVNGTDNGTWVVQQVVNGVFQRGVDNDPSVNNVASMTWADFNGDGYMDLFMGRGNEQTNVASGSASGVGNNDQEYASRIHFNDGTGQLAFLDPNNDGIGNADTSSSGMYWFTDTLAGSASMAVDWNHDGLMDIIELPGIQSDTGGINGDHAQGPINLYTNTTTGGVVGFTTTNLLTQIGRTTIGSTSTSNHSAQVSGALAIDLDWDGDRDLLAFTLGGTTTYIANQNQVAYGTSLHLRILDAEGINVFYGNTVQLIDDVTGLVVSTQIINPQPGSQTGDTSAIVDFYNLDASHSYSAVILRYDHDVAADVGGVASVGTNTVEIQNAAWHGLKATDANHAYVLTAEAENNVANASTNGGTNTAGIVGTGYNDTFFATQGNDVYNGGGGTETISGVTSWHDVGGQDIVDYKLAGNTPVTVDLSLSGAQNTGFGTATFINIEGVAGGGGTDTFWGSSADNILEGRGGNDIFHLRQDGGHDTLLYKLLDAGDATGGNGHDTVHDWWVGTFEATPDSDRIDISELLVGYAKDADGAAHYIDGVPTIDAGETITDYISVTKSGADTIISIDRDGAGTAFAMTEMVTLKDTSTDLETLLANHQIVV